MEEQAVFFGANLKVETACSVETLVPADKPTRWCSPVDLNLKYTCPHRPNDNKLTDGVSAGYFLSTSHDLSNAVYVKLWTVSN